MKSSTDEVSNMEEMKKMLDLGFSNLDNHISFLCESVSDDILFTEAKALDKVGKVIHDIYESIKRFLQQFRAKIMASYSNAKLNKILAKVEKFIDENPDAKNKPIKVKDYDKLRAELEKATKYLDQRIDAYEKLVSDNRDMFGVSKKDIADQVRIMKLQKELEMIKEGKGKYKKVEIGKNTKKAIAGLGATTITMAAALALINRRQEKINKRLDEIKFRAINTPGSGDGNGPLDGYAASAARSLMEEQARVVNMQTHLVNNEMFSMIDQLASNANLQAAMVNNAGVANITSSMYYCSTEEVDEDILNPFLEEAKKDLATENSKALDANAVDKVSKELDAVVKDTAAAADKAVENSKTEVLEEDVDDYDPMRDLF